MHGVGRLVRWVVMWLCAVSACTQGDASENSLGKAQALLVGSEFSIGVPAHSQGGYESVAIPRVACESTGRCLAVYIQTGGDGSYVVARRLDQSGPLDPDVMLLHKTTLDAVAIEVVAGTGGEYLISWATNSKLLAARFDADTGAWVDATPLDLSVLASAYDLEAVASTTVGYVVIYNDHVNDELSALRIVGGVLQETSGIPLADGISAARAHGVGSQVGVVTPLGLVRFDAAQGTVLDVAPIVFDKYATMLGTAALSSDGANYVVVWSIYEELFAARIKVSDGTLLDPPDDFNELPGAKRIAYSRSLSPQVWFDGINLVALWIHNVGQDYDVVGARLTTSLTRVQGTPDSGHEFALGDTADAQAFRASFGGGFGIALWQNGGIEGLRLQAAAGSAPTATAQAISFAGAHHDALGVASNGADFLVAYRDYDDGKVFVRAVDGVTGAPRGPQHTLAQSPDLGGSAMARVAVAWSGAFYIATWAQQGSTYFKLIQCDGTPVAGQPMLLSAGQEAKIACNDDRCAITWLFGSTVYAKRLDARTGAVLDAAPLVIGTDASYYGGDVASDSAPTADMRTFLIVWTTPTALMARRLRSRGSLVAETIIHSVAYPFQPNVVSDGTQFFATWQVERELFGRLVDGATGAPKGASPTSYAPPAPSDITTTLTYDGSSFFAVFGDTAGSSTRGTRVDASGAQLDAGGIPITGLESGFVAGASPWGRSLVAYFGYHQPSFSSVVVGRFHDNPLGSGTSGRSFVCPGGDGSGGAGGEAGSGPQGDAGETSSAGTGGDLNPGVGGDPSSGGSGTAGEDGGAGPANGGGPGEGGAPAATAGSPSMAGSSNGGRAGPSAGGAISAAGGSSGATSSSDASSGESGGCGCRAVGGRSRPAAALVLAFALLAALRVPRRRF